MMEKIVGFLNGKKADRRSTYTLTIKNNETGKIEASHDKIYGVLGTLIESECGDEKNHKQHEVHHASLVWGVSTADVKDLLASHALTAHELIKSVELRQMSSELKDLLGKVLGKK